MGWVLGQNTHLGAHGWDTNLTPVRKVKLPWFGYHSRLLLPWYLASPAEGCLLLALQSAVFPWFWAFYTTIMKNHYWFFPVPYCHLSHSPEAEHSLMSKDKKSICFLVWWHLDFKSSQTAWPHKGIFIMFCFLNWCMLTELLMCHL